MFSEVEQKMKIGKIPCIELTEQICENAIQHYVPTRKLAEIFRSYHGKEKEILKQYLLHEFFFFENEKSDFIKTLLFCILYTGGSEAEKVSILFDMMKEDEGEDHICPMSRKFLKVL